jgi:hypothetical protein
MIKVITERRGFSCVGDGSKKRSSVMSASLIQFVLCNSAANFLFDFLKQTFKQRLGILYIIDCILSVK